MSEQTVDWAHFSPEISRLFWRKFFYELKGTGWVMLLLAILAAVDFNFLRINYIWMGFLGILGFYLCIAIFGYLSNRRFSRDVGEAFYSLDEMTLNVKHNLAEVSIPTKNISKVIDFPEGVYVQYGPRLMLTLPNGPVQQALSQRFRS